jgi:hypothetical protein
LEASSGVLISVGHLWQDCASEDVQDILRRAPDTSTHRKGLTRLIDRRQQSLLVKSFPKRLLRYGEDIAHIAARGLNRPESCQRIEVNILIVDPSDAVTNRRPTV